MSRTPARVRQADVELQSQVYFARIGKYVKIGFTTNLKRRMKAYLTSAIHVELLLAIPGDRELEQLIHQKLAEACIEREIFYCDFRVSGFIHNYEYGGLDRAMQFLDSTSPERRAQQKQEDFQRRIGEARKTKAEKNAYFASLVAERKIRLGW